MQITRRHVLAGALAAPALLKLTGRAQAATTLKISHQFPSSSGDEGDFRDRLVRKFAAEVEKRSNGELKFEIYPGSSLMKTNAQFSAMRKGALDLSLYPISYAGGEAPECNIGLMPCLVSSYKQGLAWKSAPVGQEFSTYLESKGVKILTWVWQAGGAASREKPLLTPADAKGMKVRGGSREMDLMLQAAGAAVLNLPSNELYVAMQTGACDAGITSSTSLISFRLEELSKNLSAGRGTSYWFMLEPLLMSKTIFDALPKAQQEVLTSVGADMEAFGLKGAQEDDVHVIEVFKKAGAQINDLSAAVVDQWKPIARETAWKDYAGKSALCAKLLKLAEEVPA